MRGAGWIDAGWQVFAAEPSVADWVASARPAALGAARDPGLRARWLRHGGTWFAGVDALDTDASGRVAGGPPFTGAARDAARAATGDLPLHRAQVSVVYPGYPGRDPDEGSAAHRFRRDRDAAHLDGLLPEGPGRRRHLREPHGFVLGVALSEAEARAAPLVVWTGSHRLIRAALARALAGVPAARWGDIDLTDVYRAARAAVFETCARVEVPLGPGETVLMHRMAIHGTAPWAEGARAAPEGRVIAFFRPCVADPEAWLAPD